ncbi:MAG: hypothetical protein N2C14_20030, partial [Planctomycetales bacterium]
MARNLLAWSSPAAEPISSRTTFVAWGTDSTVRMTLRTLLAYLDDLLAPSQQKQVSRQIARSPFARRLLSRMQDVVRRPNLGAAAGTEDANQVAEYLDHTLARREIPDFEKARVESDEQLAEVVCCHRILALVMGEPAEIPDASRQRMYQVFSPQPTLDQPTLDQPTLETNPSASNADPEAESHVSEATESPMDELKTRPSAAETSFPARHGRRLAWAAFAAACAVGLLWGDFVPWPRWTNTASLDHASDSETNSKADATKRTPNARTSTAGAAKQTNAAIPLKAFPPGKRPLKQSPSPKRSPKTRSKTQPKTRPEHSPAISLSNAPPQPIPAQGVVQQVNLEQPAELPREPFHVKPPSPNQPPLGIRWDPRGSQLLLRFLPEARGWELVSADARFHSGDLLMAPPEFRPRLLFDHGGYLELLPDTVIELRTADQETHFAWDVWHGRAVLAAGETASSVHLSALDWQGKIALASNSILGMEALPLDPDGSDPRKLESPRLTLDLYLFRGEFAIHDGRSNKLQQAPLHYQASPRPKSSASLDRMTPDWTKWLPSPAQETSRARRLLAGNLPARGNLETQVRDLTGDRHEAARYLAARWMASFGDFGPLVDMLNDKDLRETWRMEIIQHLGDAVRRGPRWADRVFLGCEAIHAKEAAKLYRMLWGYTPRQLREGEAAQLVALLEHEQVGHRALSHWNLVQITGYGLHYQPSESVRSNQNSLERWRGKLRGGQLFHPASPSD